MINVCLQCALEPKGNRGDSHADGRKDGAENAEFPRLIESTKVGEDSIGIHTVAADIGVTGELEAR